jgi:hypothetical protein
MNDLEINKQRASLLAQARTLLNDECQQRRAEQYSKWQTESNHLWVTKGILLPYPSSFGYPTEDEVVKKALELYNKQQGIKTDTATPLPKTDVSMTSSVSAKLNEVSQNVKPSIAPQVPQLTPWEQYLTPLPSPAEPKAEEPAPIIESVAAPSADILSKPVLEFPELVEVKSEPAPVKDEVEETNEISVSKELEQAIEEVLEKEDSVDKKQTSTLRTLLAQFVTIAKKLDADKDKEETK